MRFSLRSRNSFAYIFTMRHALCLLVLFFSCELKSRIFKCEGNTCPKTTQRCEERLAIGPGNYCYDIDDAGIATQDSGVGGGSQSGGGNSSGGGDALGGGTEAGGGTAMGGGMATGGGTAMGGGTALGGGTAMGGGFAGCRIGDFRISDGGCGLVPIQDDGWNWEYPLPQGNDLRAAFETSGGEVYWGGDRGVMFHWAPDASTSYVPVKNTDGGAPPNIVDIAQLFDGGVYALSDTGLLYVRATTTNWILVGEFPVTLASRILKSNSGSYLAGTSVQNGNVPSIFPLLQNGLNQVASGAAAFISPDAGDGPVVDFDFDSQTATYSALTPFQAFKSQSAVTAWTRSISTPNPSAMNARNSFGTGASRLVAVGRVGDAYDNDGYLVFGDGGASLVGHPLHDVVRLADGGVIVSGYGTLANFQLTSGALDSIPGNIGNPRAWLKLLLLKSQNVLALGRFGSTAFINTKENSVELLSSETVARVTDVCSDDNDVYFSYSAEHLSMERSNFDFSDLPPLPSFPVWPAFKKQGSEWLAVQNRVRSGSLRGADRCQVPTLDGGSAVSFTSSPNLEHIERRLFCQTSKSTRFCQIVLGVVHASCVCWLQ
jgi:hypothetical protein